MSEKPDKDWQDELRKFFDLCRESQAVLIVRAVDELDASDKRVAELEEYNKGQQKIIEEYMGLASWNLELEVGLRNSKKRVEELQAEVERLKAEAVEFEREARAECRDAYAEGQQSERDGYEPGCY